MDNLPKINLITILDLLLLYVLFLCYVLIENHLNLKSKKEPNRFSESQNLKLYPDRRTKIILICIIVGWLNPHIKLLRTDKRSENHCSSLSQNIYKYSIDPQKALE